MALRWLLQKECVTSVIIGCKTVAQLEDNMAAGDGWALSDTEMEQLNTASPNHIPYPNVMINRINKRFDSFM